MSAAATAAGYLYASGRLRGRKDAEEPDKRERFGEHRPAERAAAGKRRPLRVAALREAEHYAAPQPAPRTRPAPRIEYRTRRWRPGE